jgi:hypothetical protein
MVEPASVPALLRRVGTPLALRVNAGTEAGSTNSAPPIPPHQFRPTIHQFHLTLFYFEALTAFPQSPIDICRTAKSR